ncbi:MAG TPA: cobalamin-binding protein [Vicinamibacterales bacterium]|nr:cobalamin-binding protein [Vicinamibacterales bacterium]
MYPSRIVCLTEETTETLFLLGEQDRIVGVSGFTVRPPEARRKPRVSAFLSADYDKIEALEPDLILAFSDLQADLASELVRRGHAVFTFNQRSVEEILDAIRVIGGIVGAGDRAEKLAQELERGLEDIRTSAARFSPRPRVFFEEWNDPLISGIQWVEELIEAAGGDPIFPGLRTASLAKDRIVDPAAVIERDPEVIIGSWCGKGVNFGKIRAREGWSGVTAVRDNALYEIRSSYILQPGPAALTEGVRQLHAILCEVSGTPMPDALRPETAPKRAAATT